MNNVRSAILDSPAVLWGASLGLAVLIGLVTSSLFGVGLFLILPSAVAWLVRR